jgi:hypothetical protein
MQTNAQHTYPFPSTWTRLGVFADTSRLRLFKLVLLSESAHAMKERPLSRLLLYMRTCAL